MKTLALVRHAKSDWGDPGLGDHDRPLADRGRHDAPRMGALLAARGFAPGVILASSATRARSTADLIAAQLGDEPAVTVNDRLYGASAGTIMEFVAALGDDIEAAMIVAHDPGMSVLAGRLSGDAIAHMPTCAVATFTWRTGDWEVAAATDPDEWTFDSPRGGEG